MNTKLIFWGIWDDFRVLEGYIVEYSSQGQYFVYVEMFLVYLDNCKCI